MQEPHRHPEELVEHVMHENREPDQSSVITGAGARPALLVLTAATSETALLAQQRHELSLQRAPRNIQSQAEPQMKMLIKS